MTDSPVIVRASGLRKEYRSGSSPLVVFDDVDLDIPSATVMTIVGASGAGKSTLLHILGGLDRPTAGTVTLDGVNLYATSDTRRAHIRNADFGFVFQFYHLMPELTALENVLLPAMVGRRATADARLRARDLLDAVGLADREKHHPSQLSGGEQQRVAIARALLNRPRILFADEPTGNLDGETSERVISLLLSLQVELAFAFVMVTHDDGLAHRGNSRYRIRHGALDAVTSTPPRHESVH